MPVAKQIRKSKKESAASAGAGVSADATTDAAVAEIVVTPEIAASIAAGLTELYHHAYVIEGAATEARAAEEYIAAKLGLAFAGNSDAVSYFHETLGMDEARALIMSEKNMPLQDGGRRVFVVRAGVITREAEHALLKVLEEPAPHTLIVLVVPDAASLLPTILSRVVLVRKGGGAVGVGGAMGVGGPSIMAKNFFALPLAARLKKAAEIADDDNARELARTLIDGALIYFSKHAKKEGENKNKDTAIFLSRLLKFKQYISGRSPRIKMILETIALLADR